MTRRRARAPGRDRSDRHPSLPILLIVLVAVLVAACGGSEASSAPQGSAASTHTAAATDPSAATDPTPEPTAEPDVTEAPTEEATEEATEAPTEPATEPPTPEPTSTPPTPSGSPALGATCAGNAENQDFYAAVAAAVAWTVYCPVLPSGWFVESGQYRLAGGGRMMIGYRGPGGAHIDLSEGKVCTPDSLGCLSATTEIGPAAFGDLDGTLFAQGDGFVIAVDPHTETSWLLSGTGVSQDKLTQIGAGLIPVGS